MTTSQRSTQEGEMDGELPEVPRGDDGVPELTTHEVTETKIVFTEEENTDGWIATDLTVNPSE